MFGINTYGSNMDLYHHFTSIPKNICSIRSSCIPSLQYSHALSMEMRVPYDIKIIRLTGDAAGFLITFNTNFLDSGSWSYILKPEAVFSKQWFSTLKNYQTLSCIFSKYLNIWHFKNTTSMVLASGEFNTTKNQLHL